MNIKPYKYYLIDLDRTLWDFDTNSKSAICKLVRRNTSLFQRVLEVEQTTPDRALDIFFEK